MALANAVLRSRPCQLLLGFGGEASANFQLVDRNSRLPAANAKEDRGNVEKSVGAGAEASLTRKIPC
jgi:hypothetical protein